MKTLVGEAAEADEHPASPCRFLIDLPVERVQLGCTNLSIQPLGLDQIDFVREFEIAVDLFANQTKRLTRSQPERLEGGRQEALEGIAALMRAEIANREEVVAQPEEVDRIEQRRRDDIDRAGRYRPLQATDQRGDLTARLSGPHRVVRVDS